jgi:2-polyprenyl-3-methyl-5-hydroxy-6-metoxy-1,4-benzoquinol methylase
MPGGGMMMPDKSVTLEDLQNHLSRYEFAVGFVRSKVILDVACGSGYGSSYLFDKGAGIVVSGDMSVEAIEAAHSFYGKQGIEFLILDATSLPSANNSFGAIVSMETIEHLRQYQDYLSECKRVLKEGGLFICSTPNKGRGIPEIKEFSPYHVHEFYIEEFQELLPHFLTEIQLYGQDYWHKMERIKWRIRLKIEKLVKPFISPFPRIYQIIRFFDRRYVLQVYHTHLSQIADSNRILDEKLKPFPLVSSSLIPKTVIAVARKGSG